MVRLIKIYLFLKEIDIKYKKKNCNSIFDDFEID